MKLASKRSFEHSFPSRETAQLPARRRSVSSRSDAFDGNLNGGALKPIEITRVHELAYQQLRHGLMTGQFEPGQKLTSRKVAAALGVSDMPVRTALARLVVEGGLVQRANGTMVVPVLSRKKFQDVMETRALLEGRAAGLACGHIDAVGLQKVVDHAVLLEKASKDGNILEYLDQNQQLKFAIYAHCGSATLLGLIETLWLQAGPFLRFLSSDLKGIPKINHHGTALKAFKRKDAASASQAISQDILEGMELLLRVGHFATEDSES